MEKPGSEGGRGAVAASMAACLKVMGCGQGSDVLNGDSGLLLRVANRTSSEDTSPLDRCTCPESNIIFLSGSKTRALGLLSSTCGSKLRPLTVCISFKRPSSSRAPACPANFPIELAPQAESDWDRRKRLWQSRRLRCRHICFLEKARFGRASMA